MIINCTKCNTKYNINASLIDNNGRKVRCIKCSNIWLVHPPKELHDNHFKNNTIEDKISNSLEKIPQKKFKDAKNLSYIVPCIFITVILFFSLLFFKERITYRYPHTQKVYDKLKYYNINGLSLENVQINKFSTKEKNFLIIRAAIKNNSQKEQNIPNLLVLLTDKNKKEQYQELIKTNQKLKSGELYAFEEMLFLIDDQSNQLTLELVNDIQLFLR